MTREDAEKAIVKAIERHLTENPGGAMVINPKGLTARILEEMGFADETEHNGWKIRRVLGKDLKGTSRNSKNCYGYIAEKAGREAEVAAPGGGANVPLEYFKTILDRRDGAGRSE